MFNLIRDYNGEISRSIRWCLNHGTSIQCFEPCLKELKQYLLENLVSFNHGLVLGNLLWQKISADEARLVITEDIGDVEKIPWLNRFPTRVGAKIERRWARFIRHVYRHPEVIQYLEKT